MSLEQKISLTFKKFESIVFDLPLDKIFVAYSGGKDSTVVLWLWEQFLKKEFDFQNNIKVLSIDTGLKFKEVIEHRDRICELLNVELFVLKPKVNLNTYPVAKDPVSCCKDLKITPLMEYIKKENIKILITGIRRDENPHRKVNWIEERGNYIQLNPIAHWTEMDIWNYHIIEKIPYCILYDQGYRSLGCKPCTKISYKMERDGRNQEKEKKMEILRNLGYF